MLSRTIIVGSSRLLPSDPGSRCSALPSRKSSRLSGARLGHCDHSELPSLQPTATPPNMAGEDQSHTAHRPAKKEKAKNSGQPNPKAFAFNAPGKLAKNAKRSGDVKEKRLHVPLVDRLPEEAPPCSAIWVLHMSRSYADRGYTRTHSMERLPTWTDLSMNISVSARIWATPKAGFWACIQSDVVEDRSAHHNAPLQSR